MVCISIFMLFTNKALVIFTILYRISLPRPIHNYGCSLSSTTRYYQALAYVT